MILDILEQNKEPMSAEMIFEKTKDLSLSTVYRTLERFCKEGLAEKNRFDVEDTFFYTLSSREHSHYAFCLGCHEKIHVHICPVSQLQLGNFTVTDHRLELYGYCEKCRQKDLVK